MNEILRTLIATVLVVGGFVLLFAENWIAGLAISAVWWGTLIINADDDDGSNNEELDEPSYRSQQTRGIPLR